MAVMMKDPEGFFDELAGPKWNYKLKGIGPITYHLGADFVWDPDGTLSMSAKGYVKRLLLNYEKMFNGEKPLEYASPLDKDDHPELDVTAELPEEMIKVYKSVIGALQGAATLGRLDIFAAVITLGRFHAAPRIGHLDRLKRICGYLRRNPEGTIRFRTGKPDHSKYQVSMHDWQYSTYGASTEETPKICQRQKGNLSRSPPYNSPRQSNTHRCSKRQGTVETSTYGSEFVAARLATEQIIDIRYTLRMMGIPIDGATYMFGDNASILTSGTIPHSTLSKRHGALSSFRVREAVAQGIIRFIHIEGRENPADVLTKFLPHTVFWPFVRPLLFWRGETNGEVPISPVRGVSGRNSEHSFGSGDVTAKKGTYNNIGARG
jgi:hypothetical protein